MRFICSRQSLKHYKAACTINELDSKAALLQLQLPAN